MLKRKKINIIAIIVILTLLALVGCSGTSNEDKRDYSALDKKSGFWKINHKAFKEIESLRDDKIDPSLPEELYIAMFDFSEYKDLHTSNTADLRTIISFTDTKGDRNYIYDNNESIRTRKDAMVRNPKTYLKKVKDIIQDEYYLWEELLSFHNEVFQGKLPREYKVISAELKEMKAGEMSWILDYDDGTVLRANVDKNTYGFTNSLDYSNIADKEENKAKEDTRDKKGQHSKTYKKSDLENLPMIPKVTPNKKTDNGLYNYSIHYPSLNKKYNLYITDISDCDTDSLDKSFSPDKFHLSYGFAYPYVEELEDRVRVTSYFRFYPLPSPEIADVIHEYIWSDNEWVLVGEEFDLYGQRYLLEIESSGKKQVDILRAVVDETWVAVELDGACIKFSDGKVYNGYYRSEIESIEDYKVEKVSEDYVDLIIEGTVKVRITIIDPGKMINIRFDNRGDIIDLDFVTGTEWERM